MENNDYIKNNQRKDSGNKSSISIDDEVQKLFKRSNGKITQQDFINIKNKYNDEDIVNQIQQAFVEKYTSITKKAKKFAVLIKDKYGNSQIPFHVILEKAEKYKNKHSLSELEFNEFQRIYENELVGLKSTEVFIPSNNLQQALGSITVDYQNFNSNLNDADYRILQEIIKLNASTKYLHSSVFIQSLQYEDMATEALTGKFSKQFNNGSDHVHPVIAALFLPKIDVLETHFIRSNISNIIRTRYNKENFSNIPDALLYDAFTKDPNDVVCDSKSTFVDLYNRALLQTNLWSEVISLRSGKYYNNTSRNFINSVDACKMNRHDSSELIYGRNDNTIFKRILAAFSFRPTMLHTVTAGPQFSTNPYQQHIRPVSFHVPMINLKIPISNNDKDPIDLSGAFEQVQQLFVNGYVVPKHTSLVLSNGVLFFCIDRRANIVYNSQLVPSFAFNKIPSAISGFDRLNRRLVNFEQEIRIRSNTYRLRSVVVSEVNTLSGQNDIVIGSSAMFIQYPELDKNQYDTRYLIYDPMLASRPQRTMNNTIIDVNPIEYIQNIESDDNICFMQKARSAGIIFMYQLVEEQNTI